MQCWQLGTVEVMIFTNGHAHDIFLAIAQKHRHASTHTAPLIYMFSTKPLDYRFLRGPLQALMVQLISNANQKWRDCVLLTRVCSFLKQLLHCVRAAQDAHCLQATVAQLWEPEMPPPPPHTWSDNKHYYQQQHHHQQGRKKQVNPLERLGTHLHLLQTQQGIPL